TSSAWGRSRRFRWWRSDDEDPCRPKTWHGYAREVLADRAAVRSSEPHGTCEHRAAGRGDGKFQCADAPYEIGAEIDARASRPCGERDAIFRREAQMVPQVGATAVEPVEQISVE